MDGGATSRVAAGATILKDALKPQQARSGFVLSTFADPLGRDQVTSKAKWVGPRMGGSSSDPWGSLAGATYMSGYMAALKDAGLDPLALRVGAGGPTAQSFPVATAVFSESGDVVYSNQSHPFSTKNVRNVLVSTALTQNQIPAAGTQATMLEGGARIYTPKALDAPLSTGVTYAPATAAAGPAESLAKLLVGAPMDERRTVAGLEFTGSSLPESVLAERLRTGRTPTSVQLYEPSYMERFAAEAAADYGGMVPAKIGAADDMRVLMPPAFGGSAGGGAGHGGRAALSARSGAGSPGGAAEGGGARGPAPVLSGMLAASAASVPVAPAAPAAPVATSVTDTIRSYIRHDGPTTGCGGGYAQQIADEFLRYGNLPTVTSAVARGMADGTYAPGSAGYVSLTTNRYSLWNAGRESDSTVLPPDALTPEKTTLASTSFGTVTTPVMSPHSRFNRALSSSLGDRAAMFGSPLAGEQRVAGSLFAGF